MQFHRRQPRRSPHYLVHVGIVQIQQRRINIAHPDPKVVARQESHFFRGISNQRQLQKRSRHGQDNGTIARRLDSLHRRANGTGYRIVVRLRIRIRILRTTIRIATAVVARVTVATMVQILVRIL